jgi:hypothetical protein
MTSPRLPSIVIDDAGFGCPVGGMLIAGYRPAMPQFAWALVPVEDFQASLFEQKGYHQGALEATQRVLTDLGETADDVIAICQGEPHKRTHVWLAETQRAHQIVHMGGTPVFDAMACPLKPRLRRDIQSHAIVQRRIEAQLKTYLASLGFRFRGSTKQYGWLFKSAILWLKDGDEHRRGMDPERLKLAKSGWDSFGFYRDLPYEEAKAASKKNKARRSLARFRGEEE